MFTDTERTTKRYKINELKTIYKNLVHDNHLELASKVLGLLMGHSFNVSDDDELHETGWINEIVKITGYSYMIDGVKVFAI